MQIDHSGIHTDPSANKMFAFYMKQWKGMLAYTEPLYYYQSWEKFSTR